jgi:hypothetical protein
MKTKVWGTLVAALLSAGSFAAAQTNLLSDSNLCAPAIVVTPSVLDFGLVAVGKTTKRVLKLQNVGEGVLAGTVSVAAPFSVEPPVFSLGRGRSQSLTVRYEPTAQATNTQWVVFSGASTATVAVTGCARERARHSMRPKAKPSVFEDEAQADFIFRYYSDDTSYVLKPRMTDGKVQGTRGEVEFLTPCSLADVLKAAASQGRRELAVVVLNRYRGGAAVEEPIMRSWDRELKAVGYQGVVFLRSAISAKQIKEQIEGLVILGGP